MTTFAWGLGVGFYVAVSYTFFEIFDEAAEEYDGPTKVVCALFAVVWPVVMLATAGSFAVDRIRSALTK